MRLGDKFQFLMSRFLIFIIVLASSGILAQSDFNISVLGQNRPLSNKRYGDIWAENNIACLGIWLDYASGTPYGVGIYDISNPSNPTRLSTYLASNSSHNQFEHGAVRDRIGYFASWSGGGVHIVSLTNAASPELLSVINTGQNGFSRVHTMFLDRQFLYEAAHVNGEQRVKVFNISNPFSPYFVQDITTTNTYRVHQITVATNGSKVVLYTSGWGTSDGGSAGQTDIWDVTDVGTEPAKWMGRIFSGFSSHSSWPTPDGQSLIVCREVNGGEVRIYDISNPKAPELQSEISPTRMGLESDLPHNPVVVGNLLFLSWYQNGIQIFDISDRTKPVRVGSYDTYLSPRTQDFQGNWGVFPFLGLNKVLLSDIQTGLWLVDASGVLSGTNDYAPLMVKSPIGQTVTQGSEVTLAPVITGSSLHYQWRLNGTNLHGATASNYPIPFAQPYHSGNYTVIATNHTGSVTSAPAYLSVSVHASAPIVTAEPQSVAVYPEQSATFSVAVTGQAPFAYQWRFRGLAIPGATQATHTIPSVTLNHAGNYSVVVTNQYGAVISADAILTLIDSPYINSVQAHPGMRSAIISWNTVIPTDAQVDLGPLVEGSITASSPKDTVMATNHSIYITGLLPNTTYNYQVRSSAGGTNYLSAVYQFTTSYVDPIIVDNSDSARMTFSGSWSLSSNVLGYYGANYRYASTVSAGSLPSRTATFRPVIPLTGNYDVAVWYPAGTDRATDSPFTISHDLGTTVVRVNQKTNHAQWNVIASEIPFSAGTNGFTELGNNASGGSVVIADAVKFSYSNNQTVPGEGLFPGWWSQFYFDGTVDPNIDHDGDGFTTGQEYIVGTSPVSSAHGLSVQVFRSGAILNVHFHPAHSDRVYTVQQRSALNSGNWQDLALELEDIDADGNGSFSFPANGSTQMFYRISVALDQGSSAKRSSVAGKERRMFVGTFEEPGCGPNRIYAQ